MLIVENIQAQLGIGHIGTADEYCELRVIAKDYFSLYLNNRTCQYKTLFFKKQKKNYAGAKQGSVKDPLLFLLFLNKCVKHSQAYHLPNDKDILQSNQSICFSI